MPDRPDLLRTLPGIGEYTAGAIASIAFDRVEPAVDGNVRRVIARLTDDPAPSPARTRALAHALVDPRRPGDFNQALMELGATVCTPRSPACPRCPVSDQCRAYDRGTQEERPAPRARSAVPSFHVGTLVLGDRHGRVLLERRPADGLLAGLWSFPGRIASSADAVERAARRAAREILSGRRLGRLRPLTRVEHLFSHRRETYHVLRARLRGTPPAPADGAAWVAPGRLADFPLPRAQRRIADLLRESADP